MYPYLETNITINNKVKFKIMTTVSSIPMNHTVGHHCIWPTSISSLLYPYLFLLWVFPSYTWHTIMFVLVRTFVCERASAYARIFSRNIWAGASMRTRTFSINACTLSRNVYSHASIRICASANTRILDCTSIWLFFHEFDYMSIRAHDPMSIHNLKWLFWVSMFCYVQHKHGTHIEQVVRMCLSVSQEKLWKISNICCRKICISSLIHCG